jgi:NADH-quinone oxidoreductase subunit G
MTLETTAKPTITIDGTAVSFTPGDTIMKAAERAALDGTIPRFCYHPGLPVAGTCRMCTVEVEKAPKLMTACSTPCNDGMVVHTQSEKVKKSRAGVMEFLLANHPLDCPVCDQAGECSLQNYNYEYGPHSSEFDEEKRTWPKSTTKKLSDKLTLNMNRCIHCERCVRFTDEVTKTHELTMLNRGWKKELVSASELGVMSDYQGNIADICPVGAITFNEFRFKKRVWFLKPKPSLCDGCSRGCAIWADEEKDIVYRYRARRNDDVNGHWICDSGRVSYQTYFHPERIVEPMLRVKQELLATNWETLAPWVFKQLSLSKKTIFIIGTDATNEEIHELGRLKDLVRGPIDFRFMNGVNGVATSADDMDSDQILLRRDKTPNTKGLEANGIEAMKNESGYSLAIYYRAGRAAIPEKLAPLEIGWGVFTHHEAHRFDAVLPGLSTLEKSGSYVNSQGISQKFVASVKPKGSCSSVLKIVEGLKIVSQQEAHLGVY